MASLFQFWHNLQITSHHIHPVVICVEETTGITTMGIVHTPRVLATLAKSMFQSSNKLIGITEPHKYYGRAGLFDVDYLGHLNNAAYLSHAEYARWSMSATNGWLEAGIKHNSHYVLTSASCRYRAEIRPVFRKFEIQTIVAGIDEKNLWM